MSLPPTLAQTRKISSDLNETLLLVDFARLTMVLKKNLVYTAMAMESQRNQDGHVFALQETRNRLQNVLERRRQAAVTEASNSTSTPSTNPASEASTSTSNPATTPMTTPADPTAVPDTKEPPEGSQN